MKRINLKYHYAIDLSWHIVVNVMGLALTGYLWWRIRDISCEEINFTILSVALGYTGMVILLLVRKYERISSKKAVLVIGTTINATDYDGNTVKDCRKYRITSTPMQYLYGVCDLYVAEDNGNFVRIKNVSGKIRKYLN